MPVIFVSFATPDRRVAEKVVERLERAGFPCFFAPRDIGPGAEWHDELLNQVRRCELVVVVLSKQTAASEHVLREIDIAVDAKKRVLPFHIERKPPLGGLDYLLRPFQFLQGSRRLELEEGSQLVRHAARLVEAARSAAAAPQALAADATVRGTAPAEASLLRRLLVASNEHEVALLREEIEIRLESNPDDIEMRMLKRQCMAAAAALQPAAAARMAPRARPAGLGQPARLVPVLFVGFFGIGAALLWWRQPDPVEAEVAMAPAPVAQAPALPPPNPVPAQPPEPAVPPAPAPAPAAVAQAKPAAPAFEFRRSMSAEPTPADAVRSRSPVAAAPAPAPAAADAPAPADGLRSRSIAGAAFPCLDKAAPTHAACLERECVRPQWASRAECAPVRERLRASNAPRDPSREQP